MIDPTVTLFCGNISVLKSGCMCQTIKCHQINKHLNCYPIWKMKTTQIIHFSQMNEICEETVKETKNLTVI
jgi:hypothetical protein